MDKHMANITFIGQLFINGMLHEKVTCMVLGNLLEAQVNTQAYKVDLFSRLLLIIAPKLTDVTKKHFLFFRATLEKVSAAHTVERIRHLALHTIKAIGEKEHQPVGITELRKPYLNF